MPAVVQAGGTQSAHLWIYSPPAACRFYGSQIAGRFEPGEREGGEVSAGEEGGGQEGRRGSFEALASPLGLHNVHTCDRREIRLGQRLSPGAPPSRALTSFLAVGRWRCPT